MQTLFDESVFLDGLIFHTLNKENDFIFTTNAVDTYLVERLGYKVTNVCNESHIALNPVNPCAKINIYSLKRRNATNNYLYNHSVVHIFQNRIANASKDNFIMKPLEIAEPNFNLIYDVNDNMTAMEMGILIKYFSFTAASGFVKPSTFENSIKITSTLYHYIWEWFQNDKRIWFAFDMANFITKNNTGRVEINGNIINRPTYKITNADHIIL